MSPKLRLGKRSKDDGTGSTGPKIRTTHLSSKGTKLYAVRNSRGRFVDIQTYKRAHAADMRCKSKAEIVMKKKAVRKRKK